MAEPWTLRACDGSNMPQFMIVREYTAKDDQRQNELIILISIESGKLEDARRFVEALEDQDFDIDIDHSGINAKLDGLKKVSLEYQFQEACGNKASVMVHWLKQANYNLEGALEFAKTHGDTFPRRKRPYNKRSKNGDAPTGSTVEGSTPGPDEG